MRRSEVMPDPNAASIASSFPTAGTGRPRSRHLRPSGRGILPSTCAVTALRSTTLARGITWFDVLPVAGTEASPQPSHHLSPVLRGVGCPLVGRVNDPAGSRIVGELLAVARQTCRHDPKREAASVPEEGSLSGVASGRATSPPRMTFRATPDNASVLTRRPRSEPRWSGRTDTIQKPRRSHPSCDQP